MDTFSDFNIYIIPVTMMNKLKYILGIKNFYSTSANNKTGIDWPEVIGRRGPLLPAHRLANQYIKKAKLITAVEVNKVLDFADIKITQSKLDEILRGPRLEFSNLDSDTTRSDYFLQNIGTVRGKIQFLVFIYMNALIYRRQICRIIFCISS